MNARIALIILLKAFKVITF